MKELVIDRIAAVDRPAQEGAVATILKRADPMETDMNLDQLDADLTRMEAQLAEINKHKRGKHADLEDISDEVDDEDENDDAETSTVKKRHKFEAVIDRIARDDGVPRAEAMSRARRQNPTLYQDFQQYNDVSKSYTSLVENEIRKGCSPNVAVQRIGMLHPQAARALIAKRQRDAADFIQAVDAYQVERGCKRTVAMEMIRKRDPGAFDRFQNA